MERLKDLTLRSAKPRDEKYVLVDGEGLYLRVRPTGKAWAFRYRSGSEEMKLSLGDYPIVSLAEARTKARIEPACRARGAPKSRPRGERPCVPRARLAGSEQARSAHRHHALADQAPPVRRYRGAPSLRGGDWL